MKLSFQFILIYFFHCINAFYNTHRSQIELEFSRLNPFLNSLLPEDSQEKDTPRKKLKVIQEKIINKIGVKIHNKRLEDSKNINLTALMEEKKKINEKRKGYWITKMETNVTIYKSSCTGVYRSLIHFQFQRGLFTSVLLKLSLDGTADDNLGVTVKDAPG